MLCVFPASMPRAQKRMGNTHTLTGCWALVSYTLTTVEQSLLYPMGHNPQGLLLYGQGGELSVHLMQPGAAPPAPDTLPAGVTPDLALSYGCYSSYFGRYEVNEARSEVTHFVQGASVLSWAGAVFPRTYHLDDHQLTLTAAANAQG
ncbi:MAG TPA: hypothetical protein DEQ90_16705, partial [Halieaceae bacterium]|nr:hypothetical protein [Halieaceae bacterium]